MLSAVEYVEINSYTRTLSLFLSLSLLLDFHVIIFELTDVDMFRYHATTIAAVAAKNINFSFSHKRISILKMNTSDITHTRTHRQGKNPLRLEFS